MGRFLSRKSKRALIGAAPPNYPLPVLPPPAQGLQPLAQCPSPAPQITQLKIASNPFAKGFRDCDPEDW